MPTTTESFHKEHNDRVQPMSSRQNSDDDLAPSTTEGYKAPAARPLEELKNLDAGDESLRRWKEALLQNAPASADSNTIYHTVFCINC